MFFLCLFILPTSKIFIILILYIHFASAPNLQMVMYNLLYNLSLMGLKNIKVPKSSINKGLLTNFHRQEQKSLGFWVFFVVLQWVLQLSVKQMMVLALENLVIYGTNVWNRFNQGSLDNPLLHLFS